MLLTSWTLGTTTQHRKIQSLLKTDAGIIAVCPLRLYTREAIENSNTSPDGLKTKACVSVISR